MYEKFFSQKSLHNGFGDVVYIAYRYGTRQNKFYPQG
jgi:hypothetical protein